VAVVVLSVVGKRGCECVPPSVATVGHACAVPRELEESVEKSLPLARKQQHLGDNPLTQEETSLRKPLQIVSHSVNMPQLLQ
jgi:hypothetical protein